jgi:hypothetical protein
MNFEYLLLILLFMLPLSYKYAFWEEIFWREWSVSEKLKKWFSHFWSYIEFPLFFFSLTIFIEPLFEIFLYNFFFYFLVLYNIFVWGKILRRKQYHIKSKAIFSIIYIGIFLSLISISVYFSQFLYLSLIGCLFLIPLVFTINSYLVDRFEKSQNLKEE